MFGCCGSSSCGKAGLLAAVIVGAGTIAGSAGYWAGSREAAAPEAAPASDVIASSFQPEGEMTPEQMMEFMKEWSKPVEEHEILKDMAGTWDATARFWMAPDAEPTVSKGESQVDLMVGGRFAFQHFTMPDFMGMSFEGYGAIGYDKAKGKYVNVWLDNFSTGLMTMEGECSEDNKTMTWTGTSVYPVGEGQTMEVPVKHVIKYEGKNKMVMEFWEPNPENGEMARTGEITYTRRK